MIVSRVPWLARLEPELQAELETQLIPREYPEDQALFLHGDEGHELFLIERGAVRICRTTDQGREVTLAIRRQGEFIGDMALLDGGRRSASAFAHGGPCCCQVLSAGSFRGVIQRSPAAALALLAFLSERLREASDRMEELAVRTVRERMAAFLAAVAATDGERQPDGTLLLPRWINIASLIGLLGTVRESASRATRDLTAAGLIGKRGRRFYVIDLKSLESAASEG